MLLSGIIKCKFLKQLYLHLPADISSQKDTSQNLKEHTLDSGTLTNKSNEAFDKFKLVWGYL